MTEQLKQYVPSSLALRDELEAMVLKELLGPQAGQTKRSRNRQARGTSSAYWHREKGPSMAPHPFPQVVSPPLPRQNPRRMKKRTAKSLTATNWPWAAVTARQDGTTDLAPAQDKALIPSSFGMTFSVNLEATELHVIASWGQYERQPSEYLVSEKTGNPKRVWKRCPRGGNASVHARGRAIGPDCY